MSRVSTMTRCSTSSAIDGEHVGNRVADALRVAREPFVGRDHRVVPALARHAGEVPGVARVAEHEVGDRERRLLDHALQRLVGVLERRDRPVGLRLRIVLEREARRLVVAGVGVVGERRKRARLHRRGRGQVGRQLADRAGARVDADEARAAMREGLGEALAQRVQVRARRLHDEHAAQRRRRVGEPHAAHAEREVPGPDRGLLEQVGRLDQHLDRQARPTACPSCRRSPARRRDPAGCRRGNRGTARCRRPTARARRSARRTRRAAPRRRRRRPRARRSRSP